jgi:hypothetical protein
MNLKELQAMIKEELDTYMNEEEVDVDVDMDAGDIDADGAEEGDNDEDILMQIYNMLKDKFEGGEEAEEEMGDMDAKETEEEDELAEASDNDLEEGKKDDEEDMKEEVSTEVTHLQERFKKLANIIK